MLKIGDKIKVIGFNCGRKAHHKFIVMGIIEGSILEVESIQPHGPYTIKCNDTSLSIGRGLIEKIEYKLIE